MSERTQGRKQSTCLSSLDDITLGDVDTVQELVNDRATISQPDVCSLTPLR